MSRSAVSAVAVLMTVLLLSGCGEDDTDIALGPGPDGQPTSPPDTTAGDGSAIPDATPSQDSASSIPPQTVSAHETSSAPAWPARETLEGNWALRLLKVVQPTQQHPQPQFFENPVMLVKITPGTEDTAGSVRRIVGRGDLELLTIPVSSIEGDQVSFDCAAPDGEVMATFRGCFSGGVVAGYMVGVGGNLQFMRLVPTNERTFARMPQLTSLPTAELEQWKKLTTSPVPEQELKELLKKHPSCPLLSAAGTQRMISLCQAGADEEQVDHSLQEILAMREPWGERTEVVEEFSAVQLAIRTGYKPEWCLGRLSQVEEKLKADETLAELVDRVEPLREEVRFQQAFTLLQSEDTDEREKGRVIGEELLTARPHHPLLTGFLADAARLDGRKEEALQMYAELAALPMQERQLQEHWRNDPVEHILPSARLAALWEEVHGSSEGLDEFLQKTYDEKLVDIPLKEVATREPSPDDRTVLLELFTSVDCPLSVAPEVAFRGLTRTWDNTSLVTLRYHIHLAGQAIIHDPLTNADTEGRYFNFYRTNLTPRIFLNGHIVQGAEGFMIGGGGAYKDLAGFIEEQLEDKATVSVDLKAAQVDDTLQITCAAAGIGDDDAGGIPESARLRLVIAESGIAIEGLNGIQRHDMIARKIIGGDEGIAPVEGKLEWQGSVNIEDVRTELHNYLTEYEASVGHQFDSIPLDLKNLSVVAIVQDALTREVLQSRMVEVE